MFVRGPVGTRVTGPDDRSTTLRMSSIACSGRTSTAGSGAQAAHATQPNLQAGIAALSTSTWAFGAAHAAADANHLDTNWTAGLEPAQGSDDLVASQDGQSMHLAGGHAIEVAVALNSSAGKIAGDVLAAPEKAGLAQPWAADIYFADEVGLGQALLDQADALIIADMLDHSAQNPAADNSATDNVLLAAVVGLAGYWQIKAERALSPERQFQQALAQQDK